VNNPQEEGIINVNTMASDLGKINSGSNTNTKILRPAPSPNLSPDTEYCFKYMLPGAAPGTDYVVMALLPPWRLPLRVSGDVMPLA
jgi:hypothetical protein